MKETALVKCSWNKFNFNNEEHTMSKTYALLDVNHTLLNDNGALNLHIVHSLLHNNILDVYLFTDMTFKTYSVNDRRALISQLQDLGLTVHGVLTTPNLFWSGDQEDLSLIDSWMAKQSLSTKS